MPGAYVRPEESPTAPCSIPSRTRRFISASSASVGGRSSAPMTTIRTVACGTRYAALIATPRSKRSRYSETERQPQSKPGGSPFHPASATRSCSRTSSVTGANESPSWPITSQVTPWCTFISCAGFARSWMSECVCMSVKPGVTKSPCASIVRAAGSSVRPTATIRPPRTPTSASNHGFPAPSITRPPRTSRSSIRAPRPATRRGAPPRTPRCPRAARRRRAGPCP